MKLTDILKNEKILYFAGGILTATYGVKTLRSDKARKACVSAIAKCMKLKKEAQVTLQNMKEEAEDICCEAKQELEKE